MGLDKMKGRCRANVQVGSERRGHRHKRLRVRKSEREKKEMKRQGRGVSLEGQTVV